MEIDNEELPILDGSAKNWVALLEECGIKELPQEKIKIKIKKKISVEIGDTYASFTPAEKISFRFFIDFQHPMLKKQYYAFDFNLEDYKQKIAPCRTFGFEKEFATMRKKKSYQRW